jgi:bifunctional non-homologous end joining protein LigD
MECLAVDRLPKGEGWVYELKLDGYRAQGINDADGPRLMSRNGKNFSKKYPSILKALGVALPQGTAVDGELVAIDKASRPNFNALQNAEADTLVILFVFDLLVDRGKDVTRFPLSERRALLNAAVRTSGLVQYSEYFPGPLARFVSGVKAIGGEGVIAKRLSSVYEPGKRSGAWKKMRLTMGQEFVIGGFTSSALGVDALIVGYYDGKSLVYVARVRAGLVPATRRSVQKLLDPIVTKDCPFTNLPEARSGRWGEGLTAAKMKECIWVKPKLVADFEFLEWTGANHVGHISFRGLRNDKDPLTVVREVGA